MQSTTPTCDAFTQCEVLNYVVNENDTGKAYSLQIDVNTSTERLSEQENENNYVELDISNKGQCLNELQLSKDNSTSVKRLPTPRSGRYPFSPRQDEALSSEVKSGAYRDRTSPRQRTPLLSPSTCIVTPSDPDEAPLHTISRLLSPCSNSSTDKIRPKQSTSMSRGGVSDLERHSTSPAISPVRHNQKSDHVPGNQTELESFTSNAGSSGGNGTSIDSRLESLGLVNVTDTSLSEVPDTFMPQIGGIDLEDAAGAGDGSINHSPPTRANRLSNSLRRLRKKISSPSVSKKPSQKHASAQASLTDLLYEEKVSEMKTALQKANNLILTLRDESLNREMRHREDLQVHDVRYEKLQERIHELEGYRDDVMDGLLDAVQRQRDAEEKYGHAKKVLDDCQTALQNERDQMNQVEGKHRKLRNDLAQEKEDRENVDIELSLLEHERADLRDLVERQEEAIKHLSHLCDDAQESTKQYKALYLDTKLQCSATLGMYLNDMNEVLEDNKELMEEFTRGKGESFQYFKKQAAKYCDMKAECNRLSHQVDLLMAQSTAQDMHIEKLEDQLEFYSGGKHDWSQPSSLAESRVLNAGKPSYKLPDHDLLELSSKLEEHARKIPQSQGTEVGPPLISQHQRQRTGHKSKKKKEGNKKQETRKTDKSDKITKGYSWSPQQTNEKVQEEGPREKTTGVSCTQSCPEATV